MACGLPAVSFDCEAGPRDIIRHEVDGLLVPPGDTSALASALDRLMADEAVRRSMAVRAVDVCDRFNPPEIVDRWEEVLERAAARF
jgi:glycosyltransferase involved in cell wall biosynthesis